MLQVIVFVSVPTLASPENVVSVKVTETEVPVVFCCARDKGGVQLTLVPVVFVAIVPEAVPHLYVMVCVREEIWRFMVRACAVPRVPLPAVSVDLITSTAMHSINQ